jgi:hypothetical protein
MGFWQLPAGLWAGSKARFLSSGMGFRGFPFDGLDTRRTGTPARFDWSGVAK